MRSRFTLARCELVWNRKEGMVGSQGRSLPKGCFDYNAMSGPRIRASARISESRYGAPISWGFFYEVTALRIPGD